MEGIMHSSAAIIGQTSFDCGPAPSLPPDGTWDQLSGEEQAAFLQKAGAWLACLENKAKKVAPGAVEDDRFGSSNPYR